MKIEVDDTTVAELWNAARRATDGECDPYAEGAFDMIQALTGNSSARDFIADLNDRTEG